MSWWPFNETNLAQEFFFHFSRFVNFGVYNLDLIWLSSVVIVVFKSTFLKRFLEFTFSLLPVTEPVSDSQWSFLPHWITFIDSVLKPGWALSFLLPFPYSFHIRTKNSFEGSLQAQHLMKEDRLCVSSFPTQVP